MLSARNLEVVYDDVVLALRGVSIDVPEGRIVAILGANGAGKTTVLKTVSGVMDPQKGTVVFQGREIQRMDPDKVMRLGIGHVPEGRETFPFLSVRENLNLPDGHVFADDDSRRAMVRVLRRLKPEVVLTHQLGDPHPDHDHIAVLVREAARNYVE